MAVTLDGITLNRSIQWPDRFTTRTQLNQVNKRTINGTFVYYQKSYDKGRKITLSATDSGWFSKTMVDAILAIATIKDYTMVLDFQGEQLDVIFDWSTGNAVSFTPIRAKETYDPEDWFQGELRLITV